MRDSGGQGVHAFCRCNAIGFHVGGELSPTRMYNACESSKQGMVQRTRFAKPRVTSKLHASAFTINASTAKWQCQATHSHACATTQLTYLHCGGLGMLIALPPTGVGVGTGTSRIQLLPTTRPCRVVTVSASVCTCVRPCSDSSVECTGINVRTITQVVVALVNALCINALHSMHTHCPAVPVMPGASPALTLRVVIRSPNSHIDFHATAMINDVYCDAANIQQNVV